MKPKTGSKQYLKGIMYEVLNILRKRSAESIELARMQISSMRIESKKAQAALNYYAKNLDDVIHPGILSITCEAVGGEPDEVAPMQVVMLLLSAAMDVHDDIIDQTDVKNGKPTIYGKFGGDMSLLIGDALFLKGFILLEGFGENIPTQSFKAIVQTVEDAFFDVGNGHLLDLRSKGKVNLKPNACLSLLEKKASIIQGLAKIGAIVGKGSTNEIEALGNYGKLLGTLIAIREEFIDVFEIDELRNRLESGYPPLPLLYAFNDSEIKENLLAFISSMSNSEKNIEKLVDTMFKDRNVRKLVKLMQNLSRQAQSIIDQSEFSPRTKQELLLLVSGVLEDL